MWHALADEASKSREGQGQQEQYVGKKQDDWGQAFAFDAVGG